MRKTPRDTKITKCYRWTEGPSDRRTERVIESRACDLKKKTKKILELVS